MTDIYKALSIAGTDPTGGAGIHADLKTFQEQQVYGMAVITSVVAQNTLGVKSFEEVSLNNISQQIDCVIGDIKPDAVKTGMLASVEIIELIAEKLKAANIQSYVMDPVMVAKSGHHLLHKDAVNHLKKLLIPQTTVITPNIPEAEVIIGKSIKTIQQMRDAAKEIVEVYGAKSAVVKGGHMNGEARDIMYFDEVFEEFVSPRFDTKHTHGTGCTFSAVITAELAKQHSIPESVATGKEFISAAIKHPIGIGKGQGPTNHFAYRSIMNQETTT
ncbi:bifunctional hydroxymethylpyrimidine kinase/phosphomethylpyrimidine kinase [Bacillus haynesii]|uniref:Hydroxymethylpyrimidine/phosphomethylpyrimidine kinase n=1 Tax=Bacillus haynesii TaxID=1925021 RepID=A0ABX3I4J6_9BACI|nr:bifunctional hydroxymethylpyrimidine kinase/phosphomethylpyrimidine kinase [Bacillus haynesii]OMI27607.1 bifunctional hydroxymethylpyrimidine kinase/phosphomethylpyrimidine kinase [Bacillus haynesii]